MQFKTIELDVIQANCGLEAVLAAAVQLPAPPARGIRLRPDLGVNGSYGE